MSNSRSYLFSLTNVPKVFHLIIYIHILSYFPSNATLMKHTYSMPLALPSVQTICNPYIIIQGEDFSSAISLRLYSDAIGQSLNVRRTISSIVSDVSLHEQGLLLDLSTLYKAFISAQSILTFFLLSYHYRLTYIHNSVSVLV